MKDQSIVTRPAGGWRLQDIDRHWAGLALLFAVQAIMFYSQLADQITAFYPVNFDQIGFYLQSYHLFERFQSQGWSAQLADIIHPKAATGATFAVQGTFLGILGGPNRTALLSLNLIYFITLQIVMFWTVRARTRSIGLAWLSIALLLSCGTTFNFAGGLYDYRIDFAALCLYGIWTCLVVKSCGFRSLRSALIVAAVGSLLVSLRFITIAYIGTVITGLFIATLVSAWCNRTRPGYPLLIERARNIFVSGALTAAITFPLLFEARGLIYNYYVVGHVLSDEKFIRALENGVKSFSDEMLYYPETLVFIHLGQLELWLMAAALLLAVARSMLLERTGSASLLGQLRQFRFDFLALALAIVVPMAILTIDMSKSPVVGGIVVVPVILGIVLLCGPAWSIDAYRSAEAATNGDAYMPPRLWAVIRSRASAGIALLIVIVAIGGFLKSGTAAQRTMPRLALEKISSINETIARYIVDNDITSPSISIDRVADYLNAGTIELYGFETLRRFINLKPLLGWNTYGIFATERDVALKLVEESDIVILSDPKLDRAHPYPMNTKIQEYWDELWEWTNNNRMLLLSDKIDGLPYSVFVRPLVTIRGVSAGWITSSGLNIDVDASELARWPYIELGGPASDYARLGGIPQPHATLSASGQDAKPALPVTIEVTDNKYRIVIDVHAAASTTAGKRSIALTFDRYFVPKTMGLNSDTRELVLLAPTAQDLLATLSK
jgi:hypothetical protein